MTPLELLLYIVAAGAGALLVFVGFAIVVGIGRSQQNSE